MPNKQFSQKELDKRAREFMTFPPKINAGNKNLGDFEIRNGTKEDIINWQ